ncbi:MAG: hypothetical protein ACI9CO_000033 [Candidatus Azotimanducaceae bacterium]|jgi:hypothetical protein
MKIIKDVTTGVSSLILASLFLVACNGSETSKSTINKPSIDEPTETLVVHSPTSETAGGARPFMTLNQGWTDAERNDFYYTSQGSQLIPYSWFLALEQSSSNADNVQLFREAEHIKQLGYIPQSKRPTINPDGLPIGFVKDRSTEDFLSLNLSRSTPSTVSTHANREYKEWLGLTCAACHTAEIKIDGQVVRIDGGAPMSDFQTFIQAMSAALKDTTSEKDKLSRFSKNVLADGRYSNVEEQRVKEEIDVYRRWLDNYIAINYKGLSTSYGYGRLDAFGAILNRVSSSFTGIAANATPSNAPVSYPFLWDTSQLSWVQWNGSANNHIGRNVGEVSGVFAHTIVNTDDEALRFSSSANIVNLAHLEELMDRLESPTWGPPLPPIDHQKAQRGKALYKSNCNTCHGIRDAAGEFPMTPPNSVGKRFIAINMTPLDEINTDRLMANNFLSPALNVDPGIVRQYLPEEDKGKEKVPRAQLLSIVVENIIGKKFANFNPPLDRDQRLALTGFHPPGDKAPDLQAYKARPLNGVWATAPYLHNGSVVSLYELLLPESQRKQSFLTGGNTFNPKDVGLETTEADNHFLFRTIDDLGNRIPGNGSYGHSGEGYTETQGQAGQWRTYSDAERYDIIEYIKTL